MPTIPRRSIPKNFNDVIYGEAGNDTIEGGSGNDYIHGGDHVDILSGGSGDDLINGGAAHDIINGGTGYDRLIGGAAKDTFIFNRGDVLELIDGTLHSSDVILDFNPFEDTLDLQDLVVLSTDGKLVYEDNTLGGAPGEVLFRELNGNMQLLIDFEGDAVADFSIEFVGIAYDPTGNGLGLNVLV